MEKIPSNRFAFFTGFGRIMAMLCSFVMPIFLTHFLCKSDYGLYSQFYTVLLFLGSIFSFGIQTNLFFFVPKVDETSKKSIVGNTLIALLVCAMVASLLILIPCVSDLLLGGDSLSSYAPFLVICLFCAIPSNLIFPLLILKNDKLMSVMYPPMEVILKVVLVIAAALIFESIYAIFAAITILQIVILVFTISYSCNSLKEIEGGWFNSALLKRQLSYALPFGLSLLLATVFRQFDKILCIQYISPAEYAVYSLAFWGIPGMQQIYDSVCEINLLNMTKLYQDKDIDGTLRTYQDFCGRMLSFTVPLILIVFVFAKLIIVTLFGAQYEESTIFFRIYLFTFIIGTMGAGTVLRASGKTKMTLKAFLWCLPVYLIMSFFGIRYFGVWGAIFSAVFGIIAPKLLQIHFEVRVLEVSISRYMPWKRIARTVFFSTSLLLPVIFIYSLLKPDIILCALLACTYLFAVYSIEIFTDSFLIGKMVVVSFLKKYIRN